MDIRAKEFQDTGMLRVGSVICNIPSELSRSFNLITLCDDRSNRKHYRIPVATCFLDTGVERKSYNASI